MDWLEANRKKRRASWLVSSLGSAYPPVDIVGIARRLGVTVTFVDGAEWQSAAQSSPDGKAEIYVNVKDRTANGMRFEVARCLAKIIQTKPGTVHRHSDTNEIRRSNLDRVSAALDDIQANVYAEQLLMPQAQVMALTWQGWKDVSQLARVFQVSPEWMESRLRGLGYRVSA